LTNSPHPRNAAPLISTSTLPPLRRPQLLGDELTQFLGAFNDNLFKQVVLLLSIAAVKAEEAKVVSEDDQWLPMLVFAAPFLMFTGFAGYLSDKFSKRKIIILCKVAEIVIMALGGLGFYLLRTTARWSLPTSSSS
jgi:hypothetical protein